MKKLLLGLGAATAAIAPIAAVVACGSNSEQSPEEKLAIKKLITLIKDRPTKNDADAKDKKTVLAALSTRIVRSQQVEVKVKDKTTKITTKITTKVKMDLGIETYLNKEISITGHTFKSGSIFLAFYKKGEDFYIGDNSGTQKLNKKGIDLDEIKMNKTVTNIFSILTPKK